MKKGNSKSMYVTLGASNHSKGIREEHDFYATEPKATELLCEVEKFNSFILEPCCGAGDISKVLESNGYKVESFDLIDRGYGISGFDFLYDDIKSVNVGKFDIITNPPYHSAELFVRRALEVVPQGCKVAMFLKLQFLEGKARKKLFEEANPYRVYVSSSRLQCAKNGDFQKYGNNAQAYAWFVWIKGYNGDTVIKWIN